MFTVIVCQCKAGHEWEMLLPNYWFSIKGCDCPECGKQVVSMKSGQPKTLEQVQAGLRAEGEQT